MNLLSNLGKVGECRNQMRVLKIVRCGRTRSFGIRASKICDGCDSIVLATAATCPSCHSYRFIDDPESVIVQARELGQRERRSLVKGDFE